jgi:tRNA(fMet)-specific endonuclease VapC
MLPTSLPAGPVLVDTDVFSMVHYGKGRYADFEPFLVGRPLMLSFCTVGELRAGALKDNWGASRRAKQESYINVYTVVRPTSAAVDEYAALHAQLHNNLTGSGFNDMWTGAIALALGAPIVTNNLKDFLQIQAVEPRLFVVHPDLPDRPKALDS